MGDATTDAARDRVLEAARSVLVEGGDIASLPMDVVAARAGVARTLVQRQFFTPAGLLEALYDRLIERSPLARMAQVFELEDRSRMLAAFVTVFAELWEHDRIAIRRLRALGTFDPALGQALNKRERYRRETVQALVRRLDALTGRPHSDAVDALCALTSFELLDALAGPTRSIASVAPPVVALAEAALQGLDSSSASL